jgi:hypothetical protein
MTVTQKLGLPQWQGNDTVSRTAFNEVFQQIDEMVQKNITQSNTPPANPVDQDLWIDTSVTPPRLKRYVAASSSWQTIGPVTAADVGAVPSSAVGAAGGVASLDATGKVPSSQLPPMNYIPTSAMGQPNGVATLGSNGKVLSTQIPAATSSQIGGVSIPSGAGSPSSPLSSVIVARVIDQQITTTSQTTVASFTPALQGNFEVNIYVRIVTAATNVTITVTYTSASGAKTYTMINQTLNPDDYALVPFFFNAMPGSPINVNVTAGTANNVYVSADIIAK